MIYTLRRFGFALFCLISLSHCGQPSRSGLGVNIHGLTESEINSIRSFRVMAFDTDKGIYRCLPNTSAGSNAKYAPYDTRTPSGFYVMRTFDWTYDSTATNNIPGIRLYLPESSEKAWLIVVEAYDEFRERQYNAKRIAVGCLENVVNRPGPTNPSIDLYKPPQ